MVKLYKADFSPAACAAMMTLDVYGVSAELVDINLMAGEHRTPEYLEKNPLHTIPVLEDGSFIIHDSHAIQIYLADVYGKDDSFYPKDPKQRALVNQMLFFNSSFFFPQGKNVTVPFFNENQRKLNDKQKNGIMEGYNYLEEFLSRNKYVAGSKMSIADIACYATASRFHQVIPFSSKYPKVQAWLKEMEKQSFSQKYNAPGVAVFVEIIGKHIEL